MEELVSIIIPTFNRGHFSTTEDFLYMYSFE